MIIQLSFGHVSAEIQMNVPLSKLKKDEYSFYEEINDGKRLFSESFYPDKEADELKHNINFIARLVYNFN